MARGQGDNKSSGSRQTRADTVTAQHNAHLNAFIFGLGALMIARDGLWELTDDEEIHLEKLGLSPSQMEGIDQYPEEEARELTAEAIAALSLGVSLLYNVAADGEAENWIPADQFEDDPLGDSRVTRRIARVTLASGGPDWFLDGELSCTPSHYLRYLKVQGEITSTWCWGTDQDELVFHRWNEDAYDLLAKFVLERVKAELLRLGARK